ncbi:arginine deiminase family protein [Streptomyces sp. B21-097]|uniref:dimethylarginine dimethylaminohydrolase family protein n=1 Tax=Streptomyces sp. B21-097 TaxID=3039414 RepID=UPI002FEFDC75
MTTQEDTHDSQPHVPSPGAVSASEFAVAPSAIIVHDPVEAGAIKALEAVADEETLRQQYLFRQVPDPDLFAEQHRAFVELIGQNIDQVHYLADLIAGEEVLEQARTNPNQVYTRDALITIPWLPEKYIAGSMLAPIRRAETATMEAAARALGMEPLLRLPEGLFLEGGDVIPFSREGRRTLLVGYGRRTQLPTLEFLAAELIPHGIDEIIGVELAPWRINLDGGLVPVAEDVVIAHPDSVLSAVRLDARGSEPIDLLGMLRDVGIQVIAVTQEESLYKQACNCLCLGDRRLICYDMTASAIERLTAAGIEVLATPGSELVKGTGGPRCMSRPLYT